MVPVRVWSRDSLLLASRQALLQITTVIMSSLQRKDSILTRQSLLRESKDAAKDDDGVPTPTPGAAAFARFPLDFQSLFASPLLEYVQCTTTYDFFLAIVALFVVDAISVRFLQDALFMTFDSFDTHRRRRRLLVRRSVRECLPRQKSVQACHPTNDAVRLGNLLIDLPALQLHWSAIRFIHYSIQHPHYEQSKSLRV